MFKAQLGQRGGERVSQEVTGWRGGSGNASASEEAEDGELRLTAGCVRREGRSQENRLLGFYTEASENGEDAFVGKDEGGRWMKNDTGLCQHTLSENILGPLRETKWGVMAFDCHEVQLTRFTPSLPPPPAASRRHSPCYTRPHAHVPVWVCTFVVLQWNKINKAIFMRSLGEKVVEPTPDPQRGQGSGLWPQSSSTSILLPLLWMSFKDGLQK